MLCTARRVVSTIPFLPFAATLLPRTPQVSLVDFSPLPPPVVSKFLEVEVSSFLGLLPEIGRCFVTFDNVLLLWNYDNPGDYAWYRGLDQPIRTVALVVPVPGVFEDLVKVRGRTLRARPREGGSGETNTVPAVVFAASPITWLRSVTAQLPLACVPHSSSCQ